MRQLEQGLLEMKTMAKKPRHTAATDSKSNRLRKSFIWLKERKIDGKALG